MAVCVFFGLKNTPLGPVAAVAHTKLNILHRLVGYTTVFLVILHAVFYTVHFGRQSRWATLIEEGNLEGLVAGALMLILLMGIFRHRSYEVFYVSHIVGFVAVVTLTGLHRPDWAKKLPILMLCIACMWTVDRVIRAARTLYNLVNNQATFYPLPGGGTRLVLKKPGPKVALPGSHGFLWIPRIHLYQSHPFSIVNNGPLGLELIIKPHGGFTKAVSNLAAQHPGSAQWASMDGPYGLLPDTRVYDKLILVSGGSGAAFTFGLMNRTLNSKEGDKPQSIDFAWAVKRTEHLSWFYEHLKTLTKTEQDVNLKLYVTSEGASASPGAATRTTIAPAQVQSSIESLPLRKQATFDYKTITEVDDSTSRVLDEQAANIKFGKMDARTVILEAMQGVGKDQRVLFAACGPKALMDAVRDSADHYRIEPGYRIDVHCEDFGS
ncbi:hypothetical protein SLS62_003859 [Diatrype stigma]|uniref:ferric-chelate reductase (NADPH) n=1 Tax=Diatrype stigma TaxID=117547 RepID=A0AAN9YUD7_9PEZI